MVTFSSSVDGPIIMEAGQLAGIGTSFGPFPVKTAIPRSEVRRVSLFGDHVEVLLEGKRGTLSFRTDNGLLEDFGFIGVSAVNGAPPASLSDLFDKLSSLL